MRYAIVLGALALLTACSSSSPKPEAEEATPVVGTSDVPAETPPVSLAPTKVDSSKNDALTAAIKSQNEDAIHKAAIQVLAQNPSDARALNALGLIHLKKSQPVAAQYFFNRAIQKTPSAEVYNNLGVSWLARKESREAILAFKKAVELSPGEPVASANLGAIYIAHRDFAKAAAVMEPALAKSHKDFRLMNNLATAYANTGKEKQAQSLYEDARKLSPKTKEILYNYAVLMVNKLNEPKKGLEILAQLKSLGPGEGLRGKINELENKAKAGVK